MKIEFEGKDRNLKEVNDLAVGDCFLHNGDVFYIPQAEYVDAKVVNLQTHVYALNLTTDEEETIKYKTLVEPVEVELRITRAKG